MILSCLVGIGALFWVSDYAQEEVVLDWQTELKQIDDEIKRAENLKTRYLAAARHADDEGMRLQFQQKQESKRAYAKAEDKRQAAKMMQARIDALNARKMQILQEHPEANERSS